MNVISVFNQATKELLPDIDNQTREEIEKKVILHMFETLKQEISLNNTQEIEDFQNSLETTTGSQNKFELYSKFIEKKFDKLPMSRKAEIDRK